MKISQTRPQTCNGLQNHPCVFCLIGTICGVIQQRTSCEVAKLLIMSIDQIKVCRSHFAKYQIRPVPLSTFANHVNRQEAPAPFRYSPLTNDKRNIRNLNKPRIPFSKMELVTSRPYTMLIKIYSHILNYIKKIGHTYKVQQTIKSIPYQ